MAVHLLASEVIYRFLTIVFRLYAPDARLRALDLDLVDVGVGTVDGDAQDLLTCLKGLAELTLHHLVLAPVAVSGLGHIDLGELRRPVVVDDGDAEEEELVLDV